jgi:DNA-binding GntR family transcriptional regulator
LYPYIHGCINPRICIHSYDFRTVAATTDRVLVTSLADEIAFRIQAGILDGQFPPGTHLQQDELCARFGVSRTPVREALRKLQATNLVDLVPNRGATVRIPTRKELVDVYAVRAELEGYACQLAAPHVDPAFLKELDRVQADMALATAELEHGGLQPEGEAAFNARVTLANVRFHGAIHRLADNAHLGRTIEELQSYFPKDYVWRALRDSPEGHVLSVDEHERIRDALAEHDGDAARRAMAAHIEHAGRLLIAYLDRHSFWGS